LKHCITKCPEALPSVQDIKCIAYLESIVKYIVFGTTAQLNYEHLKGMLVNATIGGSVENGVVRFKRVFRLAYLTLQVLRNDHFYYLFLIVFVFFNYTFIFLITANVKLPYTFLSGNINTIIKNISMSPMPFTMNKCIERLMIIVGTYSRQMCGFGIGEPTKSTTVFSTKTLARVKSDNVVYNAIFENNYISVEQVCLPFYVYCSNNCLNRFLLYCCVG